MSRSDIPVQCTRCRHQCMESAWPTKPAKMGGVKVQQHVCPKCGCRSYYDMSLQFAWCWASGLIEIGDVLPENESDGSGAILIAKGPRSWLTAVLDGVVRFSYAGQRLVPGVPEADTPSKAVDALNTWHAWCAKGNGKKHRHGVAFVKETA